jgi:hypothetical protein
MALHPPRFIMFGCTHSRHAGGIIGYTNRRVCASVCVLSDSTLAVRLGGVCALNDPSAPQWSKGQGHEHSVSTAALAAASGCLASRERWISLPDSHIDLVAAILVTTSDAWRVLSRWSDLESSIRPNMSKHRHAYFSCTGLLVLGVFAASIVVGGRAMAPLTMDC